MKTTFRTTARSVADVREIGALLASELRPGDAVGLSGALGAGKTTLVQAIVRALHGDDDAASPTFTFRHSYPGQPPVEHLDLYRIDVPGDAAEIGLEEAFGPDAVVLVEWPERLPGLMPENSFHITIEGSGAEPRTISIERPR